jgi:hypothetical protein
MAIANFLYSHIWALSCEVSKEVEVNVLLELGQTLDMEVHEYALGISFVYCIVMYCYLLHVVAHLNHQGEPRTRENVHVNTSVYLYSRVHS